jgi:hypothetical protein
MGAFQYLCDGCCNLRRCRFRAEPYARSEPQHPHGVVFLIAAHRNADQWHASSQRLQHSSMPRVGHHDGGVAQYPSVRSSPEHLDIRTSLDRGRINRTASRQHGTYRQLAQSLGYPSEQIDLILINRARRNQD